MLKFLRNVAILRGIMRMLRRRRRVWPGFLKQGGASGLWIGDNCSVTKS